MKKHALALGFCLLLPFLAFSQSKPEPISVGADAPDWFFLMEKEKPNVREVRAAYEAFYRTQPFEKNSYTNYFKRWSRWAREFEQADGSLYFPTEKEQAEREQKLLADRAEAAAAASKNGAERGSMPPVWSFIGPKETYDTDGLTKVTWQTNCYSIDVSRANSSVILAGGESGGLYRTTDKGLNWTVLTHGIMHGAFRSVKNHPTDTLTFYATTGGKIIKSTDGGATLTTVFTYSSLDVNELAISESDPNVVIAAADEGIFRTTNGGTSWTQLSTFKTWTVKQKPTDGATFFAVQKNGDSADFLISTNSGASWTASNSGLYTPATGEAVTGAIIAVCPSEPSRVYSYFCGSGTSLSGFIGVFKSTDSGALWDNTEPTDSIGSPYSVPGHVNLMTSGGLQGQLQQGFYDMAIFVNPLNADQLIAGGTSWWKSTNAGATWTALGGYAGGLSWSHPDIQWIDGVAGETWIASDGGLNFSPNFFSSPHEARMNGISGADMWGFDSGWNEDILVGGRYHNGNMGWHEAFSSGKFYRLGGGEAPTGYVSPGRERKTYYSDIDGKIFNGGFKAGVTNFSIGDAPNESYAYYANSEMVFHPNYYGTVFLGKDNKLRVSTDGGATFLDKYTFPGTATNKVYEIEICRSNPLVMYVSQWDGTDDKIWKSTDGGATFSGVGALPFDATNNNDRVKITASATDPNVVWVAVSYGSNGNKICKSTNGGSTWVNLTTTALNGYTITDILAAHGTDGGVYLGCYGAVFYRNNALPNWVIYSDGLPLEIEPVRLKPFYRDGKIRVGSYGFGVWEAPLYETSATVALAMVDKKTTYCPRDTFFFDDYSVLNHAGAKWSWSFPGATTVIGATTRTPKVIFGAAGNYTATLTVTQANGTAFTSAVSVEVLAGCEPDTTAGQALRTAANGDFWQHSGSNLTNLTNFTVTGWWKPNGAQQAYAALFSSGDWCAHCDDTEGLIFDYYGSKLWYKWPGNAGSWGSNSGIDIPLNEWSYVALVITPMSATMYLNDKKYVHNIALDTGQIENLHIGYGHYSKSFKGDIDEVTMWKKALTDDEVRRLRHITREDLIASDPALIGYWQFSETMPNGDVQDNVGARHGRLHGGASLAASTAPVGGGSAQLLPLAAGVFSYNFPQVGTSVLLGCDATTAGSLVATRLNVAPNILPVSGATAANDWFLNSYATTSGTAPFAAEQIEMTISDASFLAGIGSAGEAVFHSRTVNGDAATWLSKAKGILKTGSKITFDRKTTIAGDLQISLTDGAPAFLEIDPGSPCQPDPFPATMLESTSAANGYAYSLTAPQFGAAQDFSVSVWFKTSSTTTDGAIFSNKDWDSGLNPGWIFALTSGKIWWNVGDGSNRIDQKPTTPVLNDGKWHHFAATCDRNGLSTIYVDGKFIQSNSMAAVGNINNSKKLSLGADDENDYRIAAQIDEANIYDRVLTVDELRELAHLTRTGDGATGGHVDYFQFHNSGTAEFDRKGGHHLALASGATRPVSTAPIHSGKSLRLAVSSGGLKDFSAVGVAMTFPASGPFPSGDVVVSRLDGLPVAPPAGYEATGGRYWVIQNHGTNASFSSVTSLVFSGFQVNSSVPSRYQLYKRASNSHVDDWFFVDAADAVTTGASGSITFSTGLDVTSFSQFAIFEKGVRVAAKVFLQGNYSTSTGLMSDNLRTQNLIPTAEPHTALGFPQVEGGGETVSPTIFQTAGNDAIVDWIFLELRDKNAPATVLFTRSALLQKDGDVVDLDGVSAVHFGHAAAGEYFVAVRHRNHLGAMTASAVSLSENAMALNFTTASLATFGTAARVDLGSGVLGFWSGDLDVSGTIVAADRSLAWNNRNQTGYLIFDANLDGACSAADRSIVWNNRNRTQQLP